MASSSDLTPYKVNPGEVQPPGFAGYGWYGLDDDGRLVVGPFTTREDCEEAIRQLDGGSE